MVGREDEKEREKERCWHSWRGERDGIQLGGTQFIQCTGGHSRYLFDRTFVCSPFFDFLDFGIYFSWLTGFAGSEIRFVPIFFLVFFETFEFFLRGGSGA